jgi:hypothetical protein
MNGLIIVAIVAAIAAAVFVGWYAAAKRRQALAAWAAAKGLAFADQRVCGLDDRYPDFHALRRGSNRYAYNVLSGAWQGRAFLGFDYHYETQSTNSKGQRQTQDHYFSAAILASPVPLKPLLIRPEGLLDKVSEFFGMDDIDFESAEFSRKFFVKAPDRKWAYDVIHARAMEALLARPAFTIEFGPAAAIAARDRVFSTDDFDQAAQVLAGLLDGLPGYVVQQQREGA